MVRKCVMKPNDNCNRLTTGQDCPKCREQCCCPENCKECVCVCMHTYMCVHAQGGVGCNGAVDFLSETLLMIHFIIL